MLRHRRADASDSLANLLLDVRRDDLRTRATLHFKVGYGTVDASEALLQDAKSVLRWTKVADPIGLRGYRVAVAGRPPIMATGTTVSFARARVRGKKVSAAAVDRSGNVGPAAIAHPH
jgi:hypothetical protein